MIEYIGTGDEPVPSSDLDIQYAPPPAPEAAPSGEPSETEDIDIEQRLIQYGKVMRSRDPLILEARTSGISESRIAKLMGHSRTTVRAALASER
ncbi:hypothetical protein ACFWC9_25345 [Streptomyces goshikiensis]|uniref:hypothetical protein n=1 Tax=Streptomyces goshikiensis TaxID=1942 RepID=UPI0036BC880A